MSIDARVAPSLTVLGDPLPCLTVLRSATDVPALGNDYSPLFGHRAAVIGVDLTPLRNRRQLRAVLRDIERQCVTLAGGVRALEHIIVVVSDSPVVSDESLLRACDSVARRIHHRLEQAYARSVAITALLADGCDDRARLAERVIARARERECLEAAIALRWEDIAHTSIGEVGTNAYV